MEALQGFVDGSHRALMRQVIHGDFTPSNTLHSEGSLTGIIDFEFACPDVRAMDVAAGLYYSLRLWESGDSWDRGSAFLRGYLRCRELDETEREAFPSLMRLRNAAAAIFWMGRSMLDETIDREVLRFEELQSFNRWLSANGEELSELLQK